MIYYYYFSPNYFIYNSINRKNKNKKTKYAKNTCSNNRGSDIVKKIVTALLFVSILFFTFSGIYPVLFPSSTDVITYRTGISNFTVKKIEEKLYELGYFDGIPDSYYGEDTKYAISKFQLARKLNVSGYADNETITELDIINSEPVYETLRKKNTSDSYKQDLLILARLINSEAPDADYQAKVAIGAVVINRTKDPCFPDTICGVIYQPGAFNSAADGSINEDLKGDSEKAAEDALNGWDPTGGSIYYFNSSKINNKWIWSKPVVKVIGKYYFCK